MNPELLFDRFAEICKVPRESGNEAGMRRYLELFAAAHGFAAIADSAGNLVVQVPARGAGSSFAPIVLQSHTDMVCVKGPESRHDFTKDPIKARVDRRDVNGAMRDVLIAENTTLGADNGIGVAAALAAATDPNITHCPPLELLFTIDEERGLVGASALNPSLLRGRRLINMDSEELGDICISCAGGRDMTAVWSIRRNGITDGRVLFTVGLNGLPGGHSGVQINEGRGNAIAMLIAELLGALDGLPFGLAAISGGSKRNVIPSSAEISLWAARQTADRVHAAFRSDAALGRIKPALRVGSDGAGLSYYQSDDPPRTLPLADLESRAIINAIAATPWGPQKMSDVVPGLVETSNNIAVASTSETEIDLCCSTRSSKNGAVEAFQAAQRSALEQSGAKVTFSDGYPGWEADPDNPLLKQAMETFTRVLGAAPKVSAIHAGLECGVIKGLIPDMRMISFGPDIVDAHTVQERVALDSVPLFYRCLSSLLEDLCTE